MQGLWLAAAIAGAVLVFLGAALLFGERALLMRFLKRGKDRGKNDAA
jgi:hypothetical protein